MVVIEESLLVGDDVLAVECKGSELCSFSVELHLYKLVADSIFVQRRSACKRSTLRLDYSQWATLCDGELCNGNLVSCRGVCLCFAVYKVNCDEYLVATFCKFLKVCSLLCSQPCLAVLARSNVRSLCASCVYNLAILYNVVNNVELLEVSKVVFVLQLDCYDTVFSVDLRHCNLNELVCSLNLFEFCTLLACWRNDTV